MADEASPNPNTNTPSNTPLPPSPVVRPAPSRMLHSTSGRQPEPPRMLHATSGRPQLVPSPAQFISAPNIVMRMLSDTSGRVPPPNPRTIPSPVIKSNPPPGPTFD